MLNPLVSLHWRCWDNEWLVFDVGSGLTHQLDTLTAVTLLTIEAGSIELSPLVQKISDELQLPVGNELSNALSPIIERLIAVGLIESTFA